MNKLAKVQDLLDVQQLDALVILSDYNRRYLSDFTGTSGALIISKNNYQLITDFRYIEQATNQATKFNIIKRSGGLIEAIVEIINHEQFNHVGFEGHLVSYDTYQTLDQSKAKLISIGNEIEKIREIKTPEEIEKIKYAAKIVDDTYNYVLDIAKVGMTERELKSKLEAKMLELGADGPSFDTIVASGYRGCFTSWCSK